MFKIFFKLINLYQTLFIMINLKSSIIVVLVGLIFTINYIVNNKIANDAEFRSMKIRNSIRLEDMSFASLENPRFS